MKTTKIIIEVSHEKFLDKVALEKLNSLIEFALNDLGDSFCVTNEEDEDIFLMVESCKKAK